MAWDTVRGAILTIMRSVPGLTPATVEAHLPPTVHATPFCVITRLSNSREHGADLVADIYRVRMRVLNKITDEKGADAELDALYPRILLAFDQRKKLGLGVALNGSALLDLVEYDPFGIATIAQTSYIYCDYYLRITDKSAPAAQV